MAQSGSWKAVAQLQPINTWFEVTGKVTLPHPGFDITLKPAVPQGINPRILLLDLEITERDGNHIQVETPREVNFRIAPYSDDRYDQVTILGPGGRTIEVEKLH